MKKLMWSGLILQLTMTIIMILIAILQQPIPDFVVNLCVGGMATCIVSSLFVRRDAILKGNIGFSPIDKRKEFLFSIILIVPIIIMLIINRIFA